MKGKYFFTHQNLREFFGNKFELQEILKAVLHVEGR